MTQPGSTSFWDAVFEIRRRDPSIAEEAYAFVMDALEFTIRRVGVRRHISAAELLDGFCAFAKSRFGLMAWMVLEQWGVRTTRDVGTIVFQLVGSGVLSKQDSDARSDFDDVMDLQLVLEEHYFDATGDASQMA